MKNLFLLAALMWVGTAISQNDLDAIRYSRTGAGGSSRFIAMGGAFGAVGGDLTVGAYNPAGLAIYRKGDLNFSAGLRTNNNTGLLYGDRNSLPQINFAFNNFGIAGAWKARRDPENRHVVAFSNVQIQNLNSSVRMGGYTRNSSISTDMLNLAQGSNLANLNSSYEGLAYDTYLLDYDSAGQQYYSFIDQDRTVLQTRDIVTTGRVNDLNFSYAFTYKDKYYLGASLAFPQLEYSSNIIHTEMDDKDSMRVDFSNGVYTSTYSKTPPDIHHFYTDKLGFHSMAYQEYFETKGTGFNVKIGGIVRVNDAFRMGAYYHSPTIYRLTDQYYTAMSVAFDAAKSRPEEYTYPESGGTFSYRLITPSRAGLNFAFIIDKRFLLAIDYENVNYARAQLNSSEISDFASVNTTIRNNYKSGHNARIGGELNLNPFKVRAGYALNGSPYGKVTGEFVRNTVSLGLGYQSPGGFYIDAVWAKTINTEPYYLFSTLDTKATINYNMGLVGLTVGLKF